MNMIDGTATIFSIMSKDRQRAFLWLHIVFVCWAMHAQRKLKEITIFSHVRRQYGKASPYRCYYDDCGCYEE